MKKIRLFPSLSLLLLTLIFINSGCTKEGPAGKDGEDGIDGQDGTAGCIQCHNNDQTMFAMVNQWEHSTHATGGNFERNGTSCAPCHTSQGFLEVIETGEMTTTEAINNPNPVNCYTCHNIHESYTTDDWSFTTSDPVELWIAGVAEGAVYDHGNSNICANCHQPRVPSPLPVVGGGETIQPSSPYWGPHHGPQAAMVEGTGGYEIGSGYSNSMHTDMITDGCVTCHMANPYGVQSGGHTWGMTYAYHGQNVINDAGCTECHTNPDTFETLIETTKSEIEGLLADLRTVLLEQEVMDSSNHVIPKEMTMNQGGAVYNYLFVLEDRSGGVHNAPYAKTLLENSIASLQ